MITETSATSKSDTPAPTGVIVLTEDEIAAVGGGTVGLVILALAVGLLFSRMS